MLRVYRGFVQGQLMFKFKIVWSNFKVCGCFHTLGLLLRLIPLSPSFLLGAPSSGYFVPVVVSSFHHEWSAALSLPPELTLTRSGRSERDRALGVLLSHEPVTAEPSTKLWYDSHRSTQCRRQSGGGGRHTDL